MSMGYVLVVEMRSYGRSVGILWEKDKKSVVRGERFSSEQGGKGRRIKRR
jgi:hypothetical protein